MGIINDALPGLVEDFLDHVLEELPGLKEMMNTADTAIKFGQEVEDLSNNIANDLSRMSDDYFESLRTIQRFRSNYSSIFTSENTNVSNIQGCTKSYFSFCQFSEMREIANNMDSLEIKADCFTRLRFQLHGMSRSGSKILELVCISI